MVYLWEEQEVQGGDSSDSSSRWVQKAQLTEARKSINALCFAPSHLGLRLATGSADGVVRIYEAIDVMNLNHWPMSQCFDGDLHNSELGVTAMSWCKGRYEPPMLVVGGSSGSVNVWCFSENNRAWEIVIKLPSHGGPDAVARGVHDVKWAPNVGRSFYNIASSGKDGKVRVAKLKRLGVGGGGTSGGGSDAAPCLELVDSSVLQDADDGDDNEASSITADVWKLGWNVTGTQLACSGESGVVSMWKCVHSSKDAAARQELMDGGENGNGNNGVDTSGGGIGGDSGKPSEVWRCMGKV
jgi:nucleoporin SEH1